MAPDDFETLARLLRRRSGLALTPAKADLLKDRLAPVMRRYGFRDLPTLVANVRLGHEALAEAIAEAMTVNETSFFRDPGQFERLKSVVLPHLIEARGTDRRLRLWSAACAAGQEVYSLAMMLEEMDLSGWRIELIATDFSAAAIGRAQAGCYSAFEMQRGLSAERTARHFRAQGRNWAIDERLTRMVRFRRFNLLDSYGWLDDVDVILCRNVLMYFDPATRTQILERMADTLAPGGALFLGESENGELMPPHFCAWPGVPGAYRMLLPAALKAG